MVVVSSANIRKLNLLLYFNYQLFLKSTKNVESITEINRESSPIEIPDFNS